MRKVRWIRGLGLLLTLGVIGGAIAACDTSNNSSDSTQNGKPSIAIISKGFQHQFWQAVKQGAEQAAKDLNVDITFEGPATEKDVDQQVQMLNTALGKNPSAIAIAALDSKAVAPALQQAQSKNIPVVAFDSGVESDIPVTTASTDNKAAAAEAAKRMVEAIGGEGEIGVVVHDQTSKSAQDRRDGFTDYIAKNAPKVKIAATEYGTDQLAAADAAKAMMTANPNLKGMYGTNEGAATGVVKAVGEANLNGKMTVVGFDSGKAQIDAIKSGSMFGAVTQNPVGIGEQTVKAAVKAINKESQPKTIDTGFYWYDAKNIDSAEIKPNLYQ